MAILGVENVEREFGVHKVLTNISFEIDAGERLALIGPNGAGKSTLLNIITGIVTATTGLLNFNHTDITKLNSVNRVHLGIARTLQKSSIFPQLTCFENILAAVHQSHAWLQYSSCSKSKVTELLNIVGLNDHAHEHAHALSYGDKRLLEIVMALGTDPKLLLMDEPMAGLDGHDRAKILEILKTQDRLSLLFVEHDMKAVFEIADRVAVLHRGQIVALGSPDEIRENAHVQEIYLGQSDEIA